MSYDHMDHAGWIERNIAATKSRKMTGTDRRRKAEQKGWHAAPDALNEFQRRAFTILGIVGGGIYNAPIAWDTVYWTPRCIGVSWRGSLSTFDFASLTAAVLLAHDAAIRLNIAPHMQRLEILLHERQRRKDGDRLGEGHPTPEQALAAYRARFPEGHHVRFPEPAPAIAGEAFQTTQPKAGAVGR